MSLIAAGQATDLIIALISSVFGIYLAIKSEKKIIKAIGGCVLILSVCCVILNLYIILKTDDDVYATLNLRIEEPIAVNYNGYEKDSFLKDAEYQVITSTNSIFSTKTKVQFYDYFNHKTTTYTIFDPTEIRRIDGFKSGEYEVKVFMDGKEQYCENIILNTENMGDSGEWDYTAYVMKNFKSQATKVSITLGANRVANVEKKVFTVAFEGVPDGKRLNCQLFNVNFTNKKQGIMQGEFYLLPGEYRIDNAIEYSEMEPLKIHVK